MNVQSSAHLLKKISLNPVWLVSIGIAVLFHAAGAVAVVQAPENGLVDLVDGMLHHITIRETIEFEPTPAPVVVIPAPEPTPAPEEVEIAKAKKTSDQPGGTPQAQPQTKPPEPVAIPSISEPTPVAIALPVSAPKAAPKAPKKPKAKAAPKPAPKEEPPPPVVVTAAEPPPPAPQAVVPFEKAAPVATAAASASPVADNASNTADSTADASDSVAQGTQGGTPGASNAPAVGAHGVGGGAGSGGTDAVDQKGLMKEYLKQINTAVRQHYVYPRMAQRMGLQGTATVAVTIDAKGHITKAEIVESSGHEVLDEAALEAVLALGAVPAPPEALAWSERTVKIPYRFSLRQG